VHVRVSYSRLVRCEHERAGKKKGKALAVLEAKISRTVYHFWRKQLPFDGRRFLAR